jgi:hypothetical protein
VVSQKAPQLPGDHGHSVGGKLHALSKVEGVYGLDKADAPHLEKVVHALSPVGEFLYHRQHQAQISRNQLVPGSGRPRLGQRISSSVWEFFITGSFAVFTPHISTFPCIPSAPCHGSISMPGA